MGGHDVVGSYYLLYEAVREAVWSGRLPFWEPMIFGGYPLMAQPQQNAFYPIAWLMVFLPANVGVSWFMFFHIWWAGLGMFLLVRALGSRWLPALLAAIAFAFSGLLAGRLWAGHSAVYAIVSWTPWMVLALLWSVRRGSIPVAIIAGLPFGLAILAGHLPSFLYVGIMWAAFALYLFLTAESHRWRVVRQAVIMLVVGLGLAAVQLAPFLQFSLTSGRVAEADYQFATDYSLPPAHLVTLLVPEFFGEPTRVGYWSVPTFEELTYYGGLLAVLGIALALRRPTRLTWFLIILMVVGLWSALGRYGVLYELAYRFLPPFRVVRAPGRAALLYLFAATTLLGHSLSHWLDIPLVERRARLQRFWPVVVSVAAVAGFAALAATGAVFMAVHPTDTSGRLWHQIGGYSLALAIVVIGGALLWKYLTTEATVNGQRLMVNGQRSAVSGRRSAIAIALIILVTADMWFFALKMVRLESTAPNPLWADAKAVLGDPDGRVLPWGLPVFIQNGAMQVELPSVFGYDSLEPAAHIALASSVPDPRSTAYDLLGARYVLAGGPLDEFTEGDRPLTLLAQNGAAWVYERARPLPIARLVHNIEIIPDSQAAIQRIHRPDFDPATTAILATEPPCVIGAANQAGTAEIMAHEPTHWQIQTNSETAALLILAENAYPGWRVTVDGQTAGSLTVYTSLRAVCVPAGEHVIEWTYVPTIYWIGGLVTILCLLLVGLATFSFRRSNRLNTLSQREGL
jgi:hypothetical protein